jgi:predicted nucleotidyltransferase
MEIDALPIELQSEINIAKQIILEAGAKEIYIFGSIAGGFYSDDSDLDLATIGLERSKFFQVYGELLSKLNRGFDLIGLDYRTDFSEQLKITGTLVRVA